MRQGGRSDHLAMLATWARICTLLDNFCVKAVKIFARGAVQIKKYQQSLSGFSTFHENLFVESSSIAHERAGRVVILFS
jgi:hypothetical protein